MIDLIALRDAMLPPGPDVPSPVPPPEPEPPIETPPDETPVPEGEPPPVDPGAPYRMRWMARHPMDRFSIWELA